MSEINRIIILLVMWGSFIENLIKMEESDSNGYLSSMKNVGKKKIMIVKNKELKERYIRSKLPPNDPLFKLQWYIDDKENRRDHNIIKVWEKGIFGKGIVVGVIDHKIDGRHPDLISNYDKELSRSFIPNKNRSMVRWSSHGTFCAGIIGASINNNQYGTGISPGVVLIGLECLQLSSTTILEQNLGKFNDEVNQINNITVKVSLDSEENDDLQDLEGYRILMNNIEPVIKGLLYMQNVIDIYNCSWGYREDGCTYTYMKKLDLFTLTEGILFGRRGAGSIYVIASGNGGPGNECNADMFSSTPLTISVTSVTYDLTKPDYTKPNTVSLCSAFVGSDEKPIYSLMSSDYKNESTGYGRSTGGTSMSTAIISGIIALILEVREDLTWRDIQHIIRLSCIQPDKFFLPPMERYKNHIVTYDSSYGYGVLDADRAIDIARTWKPVSPPIIMEFIDRTRKKWSNKCVITRTIDITSDYFMERWFESMDLYYPNVNIHKTGDTSIVDNLNSYFKLEHVTVTITLLYCNRSGFTFDLIAPSGKKVRLLNNRMHDKPSNYIKSFIESVDNLQSDDDIEGMAYLLSNGFYNWVFTTVELWGESPIGEWKLVIHDRNKRHIKETLLTKWCLSLWGERVLQKDFNTVAGANKVPYDETKPWWSLDFLDRDNQFFSKWGYQNQVGGVYFRLKEESEVDKPSTHFNELMKLQISDGKQWTTLCLIICVIGLLLWTILSRLKKKKSNESEDLRHR